MAGKCQIVVQNQPTGFARLWADFFAYSNTNSNNHSLKTCYINGIQGCEPILADKTRPCECHLGGLRFADSCVILSVVLPINGKRLVPLFRQGALLGPLILRKGG